MSIKLKLRLLDFRRLHSDISRLQFNLVCLKIVNEILAVFIIYEVLLLLNVDATKFVLIAGVVFALLLFCFYVQRVHGLSCKALALCPPLIFFIPDKYSYRYDRDISYIVFIIVKRIVQFVVELACVLVFLYYLRLSIPFLSCVPAQVKAVAYALPYSDEKVETDQTFTVGNTTFELDESLNVSALSENNVLVLSYNSKLVELVIYENDNSFDDWKFDDGVYKSNGMAVQFYNATEEEISSILEDIYVQHQ